MNSEKLTIIIFSIILFSALLGVSLWRIYSHEATVWTFFNAVSATVSLYFWISLAKKELDK